MKFKVTYDHQCVITYEAMIDADSIDEAKKKMKNFDIISEKAVNNQGNDISITDIEEIKED